MKTSGEVTTQATHITSKINFPAGPFIVRSLNVEDHGALASLFLDETNPAVKLYANGTHATAERIQAKINLWGARDRDADFFRCFVFYSQETGEPVGFINFGRTTIQYEGKPTIEFGMLFKNDTPVEDKTIAAKAVINYLKNPLEYYSPDDAAKLDIAKVKEYAALVGTVSNLEGIYEALKGAEFSCSKDVTITGVNCHNGTNIMTLNYINEKGKNISKVGIPSNRFKVTTEGDLLEQFSSHTGLEGQYEYLEKNLYVHPLGDAPEHGFDL